MQRRDVLEGLTGILAPVVFAVHPRTRAAIARFGLESYLDEMTVVDSLGHGEFLEAALGARLLVSDSGGIQEECTVIKRPLLVIRRSTERPESVESGFAQLITPDLDIAKAANSLLAEPGLERRLFATSSPYGSGDASTRIARIATDLADGLSVRDAVAASRERAGAGS
jgi:UDP-N-acetylglucosamine 2-epimerase (non-hydrolysing)